MVNNATISALVVIYNAERYIRGCLESVKWADEIIVVDWFSSDRSIEIAREYTDKVFQDKEESHEARANIGIEKATSDWILKVNATERINNLLREEILESINEESEYIGYHVPRRSYFFGKFIEDKRGPLYLFKKGAGKFSCISGHETITLKGKVGCLKNFKMHWANINIEQSINKMNNYTSHDAKAVFEGHYNAFSWKRPAVKANIFNILYRSVAGFFSFYIFSRGYKLGMHGFIIALLSSFYFFTEIAKLWELQYKKKYNIKDEILPID